MNSLDARAAATGRDSWLWWADARAPVACAACAGARQRCAQQHSSSRSAAGTPRPAPAPAHTFFVSVHISLWCSRSKLGSSTHTHQRSAPPCSLSCRRAAGTGGKAQERAGKTRAGQMRRGQRPACEALHAAGRQACRACTHPVITFHSNSGVIVSTMRTTPRVMGCSEAARPSAGNDEAQPLILSPVRLWCVWCVVVACVCVCV